MTSLTKIQEKIAGRLMHEVIKQRIKGYNKRGICPTVEQVMQDINQEAFNILAQCGYTEDKIKGIVEDIIRRKTCKE